MRARFFLFAVVVLLALAAHLGLLTNRVSQQSEDAMRSRLSAASAGVRTQIALLDASLPARAAAQSPELADATKTPGTKPDERALRAAASGLQVEPDLIIVGSSAGTAVSRRAKSTGFGEDPAAQELIRGAVEGPSAARFTLYEGRLYRIVSARIPGTESALVAGQAIDDRFTAQLRSQVDADVTFLADGKPVASSLSPDRRAAVSRWVTSPTEGFGTLTVHLPAVGTGLTGKLPLWTSHTATRAALVSLPDSGAQAVVSVAAAPYLSWLARYQAFYLLALALLLVAAALWGALLFAPPPAARAAPAPRLHPSPPVPAGSRSDAAARSRALLGADVSAPSETVKPAPLPTEVPWTASEEEGVVSGPTPLRQGKAPSESFAAPEGAAAETASQTAAASGELGVSPLPMDGREPVWSVGEPREVEAESGPRSFGEDVAAGEPIASGEPIGASGEHERAGPAALSLQTEGAIPLPGAGSRDHLLASPDLTPHPSEEITREEPISAALIDRMRERDQGEPPLEQKPPERSSLGTGWENPPMEVAAAEPAWGGAAEDPLPAPWNDGVSTLPEGAPTPRSNSPVPGMDAQSPAAPPLEREAPPLEASAAEGRPLDSAGAESPAGFPAPEGAPAESEQAQPEAEQREPADSTEPQQPQPAAAGAEGQAYAEAEGEALEAAYGGAEAQESDADEAHFRETFDRFLELRRETGEASNVSYEKFAAKLRRNREELMERHHAKGVRFSVYLKDGRAAIKASALR
ncbi:MAG: MXAN_5187 C-terminal domain-containing protein [Myxococcales bacterium]